MSTVNGSNSHPRGRFLVIGAGYAGLATAIELTLAGFEVEVIEAVKSLSTQGELPESTTILHAELLPCSLILTQNDG